jgi:signal transduction histidine kinase
MTSGRDECILILAPTGNDGRLTAEFLLRAGLNPYLCANTAHLVREVEEGCGALMVAEEALDSQAVVALQDVIARQPSWSDVLIAIITSGEESTPARLRRFAVFGPAGNVTFIERPFHPETLVSTFQVALRSRRRQYQVRDLLDEREQKKMELEATVAARTVELQATVAALESLLYSMAHDLRAPLRALQGFATALEEDYGLALKGAGQEYTRRISIAAARMEALTTDLLSFGRIANTDPSLVHTKTQVALDNALDQLHADLEKSGARLDVIAPLQDVQANPLLLQQILVNLIGNAVKYVRPGTLPHVRIWTQRQNARVRLTCRTTELGLIRATTRRFSTSLSDCMPPPSIRAPASGSPSSKKAWRRCEAKLGLNPLLVKEAPSGSNYRRRTNSGGCGHRRRPRNSGGSPEGELHSRSSCVLPIPGRSAL